MPGLLSSAELDRAEIESLMQAASQPTRCSQAKWYGAVVALLFFEQSLRTRVGFESASVRLGAATTSVIASKQSDQMAVPETLDDTVRCLAPYCDVICLRHPDEQVPARVARLVETPVLNCGNGTDEHPTQALVDLLAIHDIRGAIDGTRIALVGDLRHMRSAHSLLVTLARFDGVYVRCVAPAGLGIPERYATAYLRAGNALEHVDVLDLDDTDIVYVAGLPSTVRNGVSIADQERFRIDRAVLERLPSRVRILSPLPRVDEIDSEIDAFPQAGYFRQSALGLAMRMAILERALRDAPSPHCNQP